MESQNFDYGTLIQALAEAVKRNLGDGLLLSGGLDTTILAYLASKWVKPTAITVALRGSPAPDVPYARLVAKNLALKHYVYYFGARELDEGIGAVIRIRKSFDPMEIRNSLAIYIALRVSRDKGLRTIMTGDGGDELFAGYSYFFELKKDALDTALKKLWAYMNFSSIYLARDLGLEVRLPYLDQKFRAFAMDLDVGLKVRREKDRIWGKWVLRKAFENIIPQELAWRVKAPIEVGSGTTVLPSLFDSRISDSEFGEKKLKYREQDRVTIRSKEHLFYYEIYRSFFGAPRAPVDSLRSCPGCGAGVAESATFCRTCGAYPI